MKRIYSIVPLLATMSIGGATLACGGEMSTESAETAVRGASRCSPDQLLFGGSCRSQSWFQRFVSRGERLVAVAGCRSRGACSSATLIETRADGWAAISLESARARSGRGRRGVSVRSSVVLARDAASGAVHVERRVRGTRGRLTLARSSDVYTLDDRLVVESCDEDRCIEADFDYQSAVEGPCFNREALLRSVELLDVTFRDSGAQVGFSLQELFAMVALDAWPDSITSGEAGYSIGCAVAIFGGSCLCGENMTSRD